MKKRFSDQQIISILRRKSTVRLCRRKTLSSIGTRRLMQRGMVNDNAALRHHFFEIAQAECVNQIPANTSCNNIDEIMQAFKSFSYQRYEQVTL